MDTQKHNRITPAMPFLSLKFVCDSKRSSFQGEDLSKIDGEKLIAELQGGKGEYFDLCRKVNRFAGSVISHSNPDSFFGDVQTLSKLCEACNGIFPVLADKISGWIFDFCLLKGNIKMAFTQSMGDGVSTHFLKDYTLGRLLELSLGKEKEMPPDEMLRSLCLFYCNTQGSELYRQNLEIYSSVFSAVIPRMIKKIYFDNGKEFLYPPKKAFRKRAFVGLMCSSVSGTFRGEYIPFSENTGLLEILGAVSRYTDNVIRQGLGIKTKLPGVSPNPELRRLVTDTVKEVLPGFLPVPAKVGRKPKKHKETVQKIEETIVTMPEPISLDIDFDNAKKLCSKSWRIASLMGGDYGENDISLTFDVPVQVEDIEKGIETGKVKDDSENTFISKKNFGKVSSEGLENSVLSEVKGEISEDFLDFFTSLTSNELKILECIAKSGDVDGLSRLLGGMALGFADSINEKAKDTYGDIIIDTSDGSPKFFEDYRDELCGILTDK